MRSITRVITAAFITGAVLVPVAGPAAAAPDPADAWRESFDSGRVAQTVDGHVVLVARLARPSTTGRFVSSATRMRGVVLRHSLPAAGVASFAVARADVASARAALLAEPGVASVTLAARRELFDYTPNDPAFRDEQMGYYGNVHAPAGWAISKGSPAVKIAVIDSGVDIAHPDLAGKVAPGDSWNVVTGAYGVRDVYGHGTFVAGVAAAASDNATGVTGAGFNSSLMPIKVDDYEGEISSDAVAAAIVWAADHGADVINISLGSVVPDPGEQAAVQYAVSRGVLVVAAAGNGGKDTKTYPASYPGVVSVGATTGQGAVPKRTVFSQHGSWITVGAPGENIYSTAPTAGSKFFYENYDASAGTSFSSPMAAGLAALLMAANPDATADHVRAAIVAGAENVAGLDLGAGEIDFAASFAHLPPASKPTLTTTGPVSAATKLTATSTAAKVRFTVDGKPLGAPVAVVGGTAESVAWDTFATVNGAHAVRVVDCTATDECNTVGDDDAVVVDNGAPAFTAPADPAAPVSGDITLRVTTSAPKVRFFRGATPLGAPVAVSDGRATIRTTTHGLANGPATYRARQCSATGVCPTGGTSLRLTVSNAAPSLNAPAAGTAVGGRVVASATAPGGGVGFFVDGVRRGFDGTAPYAAPLDFSALAAGARGVTARGCSTDGARCAGPSSAAAVVSNTSLRPAVTAATAFSPNGDGAKDVLAYDVTVAGTQAAVVRVVSATGATVHGPRSLGTLAAGTHRFTWSGRKGVALPDGRYTIEVTTSAGSGTSARAGWARRSVRIDTTRPALSALTAAGTTFHPVRDGYQDIFVARVTAAESVRLQLVVRNANGHIVHRGNDAKGAAGRRALAWAGRINGGPIAPAGSYLFSFTATDSAGNRRVTAGRVVKATAKRLVEQTATALVAPADYVDPIYVGCGAVDEDSEFEDGLILAAMKCSDANYAQASWRVKVPAAAVYRSVRLMHVGYSMFDDAELAGFVRNTGTGALDSAGTVDLTGRTMLREHRAVPATGHIANGQVEIALRVDGSSANIPDVIDLARVGVEVVYAVLR